MAGSSQQAEQDLLQLAARRPASSRVAARSLAHDDRSGAFGTSNTPPPQGDPPAARAVWVALPEATERVHGPPRAVPNPVFPITPDGIQPLASAAIFG